MKITNQTTTLPWHPSRRWSTRDLSTINKIIIHQELGESNIEAVNLYHIRPNHISHKGCPHFCYHYGIEETGDIIQANELSQICWHTKGQNDTGISIMLVGNFSGSGHDMAGSEPTDKQINALEFLVDYLNKVLSFSHQELYGHYHFGKPACPGYKIQEWIENRRNIIEDVKDLDKIKKTAREIQKSLNTLGYNCGKPDGIIGVQTLSAIRSFQRDQRLNVDGIVGPQTWKYLLLKTS